MEEVDKEAKEEEAKPRAQNTKNNNNDMKKTNKEKNSNTSGNHYLSRTNLLPPWGETCFERRQGRLGRKYVSRPYPC